MIEPAGPGQPLRRAYLRVGGKTLAQHQAEAALACGCDKVVCLAREMTADLAALQQGVEAAGRAFHSVASPRDLPGIVTSGDEMVVFAEGLLVDPVVLRHHLEPGAAVLVQPVETGVPEGFERLDLNRASAGILRIPGRLVDNLVELPVDSDVPSALTRIALQAGVAMREIPAAARTGVIWRLVSSEMDAYALDNDWIAHRIGEARGTSPSKVIARFAALTFGPSLLHGGNAGAILGGTAAAVVVLGIAIAWLAWTGAAFAFFAISWLVLQTALLLRKLEVAPPILDPDGSSRLNMLEWFVDLAIIATMVIEIGEATTHTVAQTVFPPLMLILLIRLIPQVLGDDWTDWIRDRALLATLLIVLSLLGILPGGVRVLAVVLAVAGLILTASKPRITAA
jgi:hypothetical protein